MNTAYNIELPTIETRRLTIRPFVIEDAVSMYHNWASDSRVTKYLTWNPHSNIEETKNIITRWISDANNSTELTFAIEYKENNTNYSNSFSLYISIICNIQKYSKKR
mgnify:CR=1 FL=1